MNRLSYRTNDFLSTLDKPCTSSGVSSRMDGIWRLVGTTAHQSIPRLERSTIASAAIPPGRPHQGDSSIGHPGRNVKRRTEKLVRPRRPEGHDRHPPALVQLDNPLLPPDLFSGVVEQEVRPAIQPQGVAGGGFV